MAGTEAEAGWWRIRPPATAAAKNRADVPVSRRMAALRRDGVTEGKDTSIAIAKTY